MIVIDNSFLFNNMHILSHRKCVIVVGAGISVESGIPDFRSPSGIFSSLRKTLKVNGKDLFTYNFGIKEGTRQIYLKYISDLKRLCDKSTPNFMHEFLVTFPKSRVYTQNIDGLEERAGMVFNKTDNTKGVYLHGNLAVLNCQYCGYKQPFTEDEAKKFSNAEEIVCKMCLERRENCIKNNIRKRPVGVMHPGIIHYQQIHPDGAFIGRMTEKDKDCDLLIVIGTSLRVEGIKKLVKMFAKSAVGKRIYVNLTPPTKEFEQVFDYYYPGNCTDFARQVNNKKSVVKMESDPLCVYSNIVNGNKKENNDLEEDLLQDTKIQYNTSIIGASNTSIIDANNTNSLACKDILDENNASALDCNLTTVSDCEDNSKILVRRQSAPSCASQEIHAKIEKIVDVFNSEENISKPIFDDVLKEAKSTTIVADSSFLSLQDEFEDIVRSEHAKLNRKSSK